MGDATTLIPLQPTGVMQGRIVVLEPDGPGKEYCERVEPGPDAVARVEAKMDAAIKLKEEGIVVKQIHSLWEPGARNQLCARSLLMFPLVAPTSNLHSRHAWSVHDLVVPDVSLHSNA